MKILLLNYSDKHGGASIATIRLYDQLKEHIQLSLGVIQNYSLKSICLNKLIKKNNYLFSLILKTLNKIYNRTFNSFITTNPILHSENMKSNINIYEINNSNYDIIHLHWLNNDMISIEDIAKINKPIVWTMHDCWPFCGAEHYPNILENDTRYIKGYTKQNKPKTSYGLDICRKTWERKNKAWKNIKFNFISPSNFEKNAFKNSALFNNLKSQCTVIPNIVPEDIFRPLDKLLLKKQYGLPLNKIIIGFGAAGVVTDQKSIKGEYLLIQALKKITDVDNYLFVIFGNAHISFLKSIDIPVFEAGFITNPYILASIYNICDVFVCPSLLENLPNVCLESLFCGIPVAAFNTGGIPDIVEHKITGYLADCFDTDDLHNGIMYCIDNHDILSKNSLIKAKRDFDNETIVKRHIELYATVLQENRSINYRSKT